MLENIEVVKITKAANCEEAIAMLAKQMVANGWAREGLQEAVIERERKYPTGLHTPSLDVALPHADAEWTLEPSLLVGVLQEPVAFKAMDGSSEDIQAQLIFLLAIPSPGSHVRLLQSLTKLIANKNLLVLYEQADEATLASLLTEVSGD